jgi:predicted TIM-barrel fold metal-dependent hydrolase
MTSIVIDAHQHFWDPTTGDYPWLAGPFEPIARIFGPEDLRPSLAASGGRRRERSLTSNSFRAHALPFRQ